MTAVFDRAFPGILLQKTHRNFLDHARWQVILAAWDEYAVCRIAGSSGYDPADGYLEVLLKILGDTRGKCFEVIKAYRTHGDVGRVATEVYGKLGDLLKYSLYFLGAIAARENPETHPRTLAETAKFEWFEPFFDRLIEVNEALWSEYRRWKNLDTFEAIGDVLEDMSASIGMVASRTPDEQTHFNFPYRLESMPDSFRTNAMMRLLFEEELTFEHDIASVKIRSQHNTCTL